MYGSHPPDEPLAPVLVSFAGPAPQRRLTVLVRVILAIPHLICLWALGIASAVLTVIAWFSALFTGSLPGFAAEFLGGYLHWWVRVAAYLALLTDQYPPFSLGDAPYPVRIAYRPGRLNRLAVLFRLFLMIPAAIVIYLLEIGTFTVVGVVTWLIVLFTGRMPAALYQAFAAVVRYLARYQAFAMMLTSAYPGGVFGDGEPEAARLGPWGLVLSRRARVLVGVFIVVGVLAFGGDIASTIAGR